MKVYLRDRHPGALWLCRPPHSLAAREAQPQYRADRPASTLGPDGQVRATIAMAPGDAQQATGLLDVGDERALSAALVKPVLTLFGLPAVVIVCPALTACAPVELVAGLTEAGARVWVDLDDDYVTPMRAAYWEARLPDAARVEAEQPMMMMTGPQHQRRVRAGREPTLGERQARIDRLWEALRGLVGAATGVIASTPVVAALARRYTPRAVVMPNMVDPTLLSWPWPPRPSAGDGILRIGVAGNITHNGDDLACALPALLDLGRRRAIELHFWGAHPRFREGTQELLAPHHRAPGVRVSFGLRGPAPPARLLYQGVPYHYHGFVEDFGWYHHTLSVLDIALAPLVDTATNRAKSACRWLDHSVHGTAMVLSDLPPYDGVEHGATGFKARTPDDFRHYLGLLVEDAPLRRRMGAAAHEEVRRAHTTAALGPAWRAFVAEEAARSGS